MKTSGNYRHGAAKKGAVTRTYKKWLRMNSRCFNPAYALYHRYGGRGITVCDRWRDYANFLEDMGEAPIGKSLDRYPNKDGNYEPGNCRWATDTEQGRNRSITLNLTLNGVTKTVKEWADERGLNYKALWSRLNRGLSVEEALDPNKRKTGVKKKLPDGKD